MKKSIYTLLILVMSQITGMASDNLTFLCDEWNVAEAIEYPTDHKYQTFKWRLTTDTVINAQKYVKIEKNHRYEGALREDDDANIYFVPSDSTKEFLLYAFHAQVGDALTNLWVSRKSNSYLHIRNATISDIQPTDPKVITVELEFSMEPEFDNWMPWHIYWTEGIGHREGSPIDNDACLGCTHLDPELMILCAYTNGEQVFMNWFAEAYGCDYYLQDNNQEDIHMAIPDTPSATKLLHNGQILIIRNDKTYTITGQRVE